MQANALHEDLGLIVFVFSLARSIKSHSKYSHYTVLSKGIDFSSSDAEIYSGCKLKSQFY